MALTKVRVGGVDLTTTDNSDNLTLTSTDADANAGPILAMNRDSASPADNDLIGKIKFSGDDDGGNSLDYATINIKATDVSDGSEDGEFDISTVVGGSSRSRMRADGSEIIFNENSVDVDFRVESNGQTDAIFVNAGDDITNFFATTTVNTAGNNTDDGVSVYSSGRVDISRASGQPLNLRRRTDNGTLIAFYHEASGSTSNVGEVRLRGAEFIAIGAQDTFLEFNFGSDQINPSTGSAARDDAIDLGSSSAQFDDIFATTGSIQSSDSNRKNTITDSDLGLDFINRLSPKSYIYNGKTRVHYGLIAQDVESVLSDINKPTTKFAGFIKDEEASYYGLRYQEFISPMIQAIKDLKAEVDTLKAKITALENA